MCVSGGRTALAACRELATTGRIRLANSEDYRPTLAFVNQTGLDQWTATGVVERTLSPWLKRPVLVQPCLCDIWHDHALFDGESVGGMIDYGAMKIDSVAVDLARLLGSLVEDNAELRNVGLAAYGRIRPLSLDEEALVGPLDEATVVLGAANWLKWLYLDKKQFENLDAVAQRLAKLVERLERWSQ